MQISLRAFLVLLTVACLWLGYLANRAHRQRAAVAAIRGLGGSVWYEFEEPDFLGSPVHPPSSSGGLRSWLGRDFFEKVMVVRYPAIERDAYGFYHLREDFHRSAGNAVLQHLSDLPDLERLALHDDSVTDSDLQNLATLSNLRELNLSGSEIGDAGVAFISKLPRLEALCLQGGSLESDALRRGQVDDRLEPSPVNSEISDASLHQLASLPRLERLTVGGRRITDDGLRHVALLKSLRELSLRGTSVTREGVNRLRKELPATWISY